MVKFNIESICSFNTEVHKKFSEDTKNVINIPYSVLKSPEISSNDMVIRAFICKYKQMNMFKTLEVKNEIDLLNMGYIDNDVEIVKCIVMAKKIRMDALFSYDECLDKQNTYKVAVDMSDMEMDIVELGDQKKEFKECSNLLTLSDALRFIETYCNNPFVDIEITICLNNLDFKLLNRNSYNNNSVRFVECFDFMDDEDTISIEELFEMKRAEQEQKRKYDVERSKKAYKKKKEKTKK